MNIKGMVRSFQAMMGFGRDNPAPTQAEGLLRLGAAGAFRASSTNTRKKKQQTASRSRRTNRGVTAHGRRK